MTDEALPTTNRPAKIANQAVVDLFNQGLPLAEKAIIAAQPWLGWPVICQIWEALLKWITDKISMALGTLSGYVVMDAQSYLALTNASAELEKLKAAQASGDSNAISEENKKMDEAVAPILHYVGDAHP